jgi:hypothetical protein
LLQLSFDQQQGSRGIFHRVVRLPAFAAAAAAAVAAATQLLAQQLLC